MPINQIVNNESIKQVCRSGEQLPKPPRPAKGSLHMAKAPTFCCHPDDLDGCRKSLTQAWREGSIGEYCIMEGLRANLHQCRQVLLEGLYDKTSPRRESSAEATAARGQSNGLDEACKVVVLLGYPLEVKAVQEVFHEAYYKLVRSKIYKFGIRDNDDPSADDVFQNVFLNIHKQFRRGASIRGPLAVYITRVALHECFRWLRDAARHTSLPEDVVEIETSLSYALLPPPVVEYWEHLDHRLSNSDQGDLINRIILAQQCMEGCVTDKKPSAKHLMADWQCLSQISKGELRKLHEKVVERLISQDLVYFAAEFINAGVIKPHQVAVIFAAGTGMNLEQTHKLVGRLSSLSATAIFARIHRIYKVLQPPGMEEQ